MTTSATAIALIATRDRGRVGWIRQLIHRSFEPRAFSQKGNA